jgi:hypothetical protein
MGNSVVLVQPDPFIGVGDKVTSYIPNYRLDQEDLQKTKAKGLDGKGDNMSFGDINYVSRPLNGIAAKPNTHAYVQILNADARVIKVFNQLGLPGGVEQSGDRQHQQVPKDPYASMSASRAGKGKPTPPAGGGLVGAVKSAAGMGSGSQSQMASPGMGIDDQGNPASNAWTDWILSAVREIRMEKTQLVETFGDSYLYAFGEKPRVLGFSGLLMNTLDYNWRAVFWENWDRYFRATKLIEMDARMYIGWEDIVVEGYPIQAVAQESAESPNAMSFTFQFYVTNYWNMSMVNVRTLAKAKKKYHLAMSRSMYSNTKVFDNEITSDLFSVFDTVLGKGAASHAFFMDEQSKSIGEMSEFERLGVRSAKKAADALTKLPYKLLTLKSANITAFLNATLLQLTYDALKTAGTVGIQAAEKAMKVQRGEINAWFGYAGALADTALNTTSGRWDGNKSNTGDMFLDMFRGGSLDRVIQRMSYQLIGLLGTAGRYRGATTEVDITTGSNMKYGAAPGAAVVIHETPVNANSSTDLSITTNEAIQGTSDQDESGENS